MKEFSFLPANRRKCDAIEWTEKHIDQPHALSKPHLLRLVFHREYLCKIWVRQIEEGLDIITVKELTSESIRLWRDGASSSNLPEGHRSDTERWEVSEWTKSKGWGNVESSGKSVCPDGLLKTCPSAWSCIKESWRHLEDEGHEIRSRVGQPWKLGICHKALALAPLSVSLYLKASVSCKYRSGKHSLFCKIKIKSNQIKTQNPFEVWNSQLKKKRDTKDIWSWAVC